MSRRSRLLKTTLAANLLLSTVVGAHEGRHPETLRALLKPDGLHVSVHFTADPGPEAEAFRRRFDANGDGRLDQQEREVALDSLQAGVVKNISARIDRTDLRGQVKRRDALGLVGAVSSSEPISASFQIQFAFQLAAGDHRLAFRARSSAVGSDVPTFLQLGKGLALGSHNSAFVNPRADTLRASLDADHPLLLSFGLLPARE